MNSDFIVPKLRTDLNIDFFNENNEDLVVLSDPNGYSLQPVAMPALYFKILNLIDGIITFTELNDKIKTNFNIKLEPEFLIDILKGLNDQCLLDSADYYFVKFQIDHYKSLPVRPPVCAGNSYPYDPAELETKIEEILNSVDKSTIKKGAKFLMVPHIDFNLGKISHEVYAPAYHSIRDTDADLFVIFGTAHHRSSDLFMLSEKDFQTPLGILETDKQIIKDIQKLMPGTVTIDEFAHKPEHSIELHLVLLQHLFKDRKFTILPILTGSFHRFLFKKNQPNKNEKFFDFLNSLKKVIEQLGRKELFIASGDFAHIGRKFDDNFDAEPILNRLKDEDQVLINHLANNDSEGFFNEIAYVNDMRKICGLSPFYSILEYHRDISHQIPYNAKFLKYNQWNEIETRSAVTFASIAYY